VEEFHFKNHAGTEGVESFFCNAENTVSPNAARATIKYAIHSLEAVSKYKALRSQRSSRRIIRSGGFPR
jgi:hypothetical protein